MNEYNCRVPKDTNLDVLAFKYIDSILQRKSMCLFLSYFTFFSYQTLFIVLRCALLALLCFVILHIYYIGIFHCTIQQIKGIIVRIWCARH